jgi:hypothetical protein
VKLYPAAIQAELGLHTGALPDLNADRIWRELSIRSFPTPDTEAKNYLSIIKDFDHSIDTFETLYQKEFRDLDCVMDNGCSK